MAEVRSAADPRVPAADRAARVTEFVETAAAEIIWLAPDLPIETQASGW